MAPRRSVTATKAQECAWELPSVGRSKAAEYMVLEVDECYRECFSQLAEEPTTKKLVYHIILGQQRDYKDTVAKVTQRTMSEKFYCLKKVDTDKDLDHQVLELLTAAYKKTPDDLANRYLIIEVTGAQIKDFVRTVEAKEEKDAAPSCDQTTPTKRKNVAFQPPDGPATSAEALATLTDHIKAISAKLDTVAERQDDLQQQLHSLASSSPTLQRQSSSPVLEKITPPDHRRAIILNVCTTRFMGGFSHVLNEYMKSKHIIPAGEELLTYLDASVDDPIEINSDDNTATLLFKDTQARNTFVTDYAEGFKKLGSLAANQNRDVQLKNYNPHFGGTNNNNNNNRRGTNKRPRNN